MVYVEAFPIKPVVIISNPPYDFLICLWQQAVLPFKRKCCCRCFFNFLKFHCLCVMIPADYRLLYLHIQIIFFESFIMEYRYIQRRICKLYFLRCSLLCHLFPENSFIPWGCYSPSDTNHIMGRKFFERHTVQRDI